jgi:Zn-finger nucleic acid-binding protein
LFGRVEAEEDFVDEYLVQNGSNSTMSRNEAPSMIVLEFEGVEIDYCPETGAIWLDAGELEQIGHLAGADPARLARAIREGRPRGRGDKRCPRCGKRLDRVAVSETLELDRCPRGFNMT